MKKPRWHDEDSILRSKIMAAEDAADKEQADKLVSELASIPVRRFPMLESESVHDVIRVDESTSFRRGLEEAVKRSTEDHE